MGQRERTSYFQPFDIAHCGSACCEQKLKSASRRNLTALQHCLTFVSLSVVLNERHAANVSYLFPPFVLVLLLDLEPVDLPPREGRSDECYWNGN